MNKEELTLIKDGCNADKHNEININAVPAFPLFETFTVFCFISTNNPPIETNISLSTSKIIKFKLKNDDNQKINSINTTRSATGSNIIPNFETRLNLRATIPSIESLIPIIAIINIRLRVENSSGSYIKNI